MGLNNKGSLLRAFVITMALPFLRLPLTPQGVRLKSGPFFYFLVPKFGIIRFSSYLLHEMIKKNNYGAYMALVSILFCSFAPKIT